MPINRVVIVGNLTKDPELRGLPSGGSVCQLRVAVNERRKNAQTGQWDDHPNYFSVTVFGNSADATAKFLSKGRQVAIDGRLRWREWQDKDGARRESVEIVAQDVQFIGGREEGQAGGLPTPTSSGGDWVGGGASPRQPDPPAPSSGGQASDDIPFAFPVEQDHRSHDHNPFA
jgi:single-strand DNA-binding protein